MQIESKYVRVPECLCLSILLWVDMWILWELIVVNDLRLNANEDDVSVLGVLDLSGFINSF